MSRIVLGNTKLEVNRLGLGGIPIQRIEEDEAVDLVLYAVEKGIDFIDTSRVYTNSERRIGLALKQTRKRVVVASKSLARTSDELRADLEKSLTELERSSIDIYQCHNIKAVSDYEQAISSHGALEALIRAKEEGLIGHIGVSSHSLDMLDRILDDGFFETIMLCFSFLEHSAREKIIPKALRRNIGVLAMKPFSGGVINEINLALKYALSQTGILVLAGVEYKHMIDQNWEIFQGRYGLDAAEMAEIEQIRKKFEKNFCRRCDYCQPCTEGIPIQYLLGLRSLVKRRAKTVLKEGWIREAVDKGRNCSECGLCLSRCPYELPIPDLIKENLKWADEELGKP
jgi:predicted aldo/keto reductase-like oxidoreductase